jgi:hypothetical protein
MIHSSNLLNFYTVQDEDMQHFKETLFWKKNVFTVSDYLL